MAQFLPAHALTGGADGAIDALFTDGSSPYYNALAAGDIALVYYNDRFYVYRFYIAGSAYTESSPTIIKPDNQSSGTAYTGNGAWLLVDAMSADFLSPLRQAEISVTGAATATIGRMHVCSGTSADYTVTLPAAADCTGKMIGFRMSSALTKLVTLDGNESETIDGATTRIMWANESAILLSDGTGWTKVAGRTIPMQAELKLASAQLFSALNKTLLNYTSLTSSNCPAAFVSAADSKIIAVRPYPILFGINAGYTNTGGSNTFVACFVSKNTALAFDLYAYSSYTAGVYACPNNFGTLITSVGDYFRPYGYFGAGTFTTSTVSPYTSTGISFMSANEQIVW